MRKPVVCSEGFKMPQFQLRRSAALPSYWLLQWPKRLAIDGRSQFGDTAWVSEIAFPTTLQTPAADIHPHVPQLADEVWEHGEDDYLLRAEPFDPGHDASADAGWECGDTDSDVQLQLGLVDHGVFVERDESGERNGLMGLQFGRDYSRRPTRRVRR